MASRVCTYKDCENYYLINDSTSTTLFAPPKQPERAQIWRKNGRVHPKIPPHKMFMCFEHFDKKYISCSKNRKILVGEAVPYPYEGSPEPEEAEALEQVASTSSQESYFINLIDSDELSINNVESTTGIEISLAPPSTKRSRTTVELIPLSEPPAKQEPSVVEDQAIDPTEVSTFIFKGEEYVQMSKSYYMREKREIAQQLRQYKTILKNIKEYFQDESLDI
ncbi:GL22174 [Drosophila persimilis]|uniref:GL22174 n=1 Tax=Drosophila persimilis TaxID=7234 RepID=B4GFB1_DROPE|nr:GL22174 [Drosophila persimilis]